MADRATIFGSEAEAYDRLRPRYPAEAIDLIVLDDPDVLVDAGCGTGIAARQVADRGVDVIGVEPDVKMAALARSHGIEVVVARFEDWEPIPCDGLLSAQAWHWIDPDRGAEAAAAAIRAGGRWTACWNFEVDTEIGAVCEGVYGDVAPELVKEHAAVHPGNKELEQRISRGFEGTGCFEPLERHTIDWVDRIATHRFVDRVDSYSAHRLLADEQRRIVRAALVEALGANSELRVDYCTEVFTARRR